MPADGTTGASAAPSNGVDVEMQLSPPAATGAGGKPSIADRKATQESHFEEHYEAQTARQPPSNYAISPEISANWLSRQTWHYLNPLMFAGWKRPLEMTDMYPLMPQFQGKFIFNQFAQNWDKELGLSETPCRAMAPAAKAMLNAGTQPPATAANGRRASFATASDGSAIPILGGENRPPPPPPDSKEKPKTPSLTRALFATYGRTWIFSGFMRIISDASNICSPLVLQQVIAYLTNKSAYPSWYGYVMAFVLFVLQLFITFFSGFFLFVKKVTLGIYRLII